MTQSFYKHDGYDIVALVHIVQVLLPITSCVIFIVCFVYYWVKIAGSRQYQHLTDTDWSTVAAYYGVSLYFTLYAFSLDCVAVNHRRVGAEFIRDNEFIKNFVYAPFALDFVAVVIIAGLFLIPYFGRCCHCTMSEYTKCQFICLSLAGLAPFFCIISHAHFIVIAWITDPAYASGIGAFYGFLVVVYFLIFKFVYHQCNHLLLSIYCYNTSVETTVRGDFKRLSFAALLIMLAAGLFLTGYFGMISCFFILIPITKSIEDTPTQAYAIYQGIIVVLTALLAYVVIVKPGSFSITTAVKTAIKGIKEAEGKKIKDDWMKIGDEERLAGVIAKTVTDHILKQAPEQDEQAPEQDGHAPVQV